MLDGIVESIDSWAARHSWPPRALVVAACAVLGVALLFDSSRNTPFGAIDLAIHEMGHPLFRFGGEVLCALGGTLLQCLVPLFAATFLYTRGDWFGITFCGVWLGVNFFEVARYMADARAMQLQLVTIGGGDARHDWNFLFGEFGCLRSDTTIAGLVRGIAFLVLWGSIAAGVALVVWMARAHARAEAPRPFAMRRP